MKTIGFNETGRRQRRHVEREKVSRHDAVACITAMQHAKDKPGDRRFKPLRPPPGALPARVSRAGAIEAARLNANRVDPELHNNAEVATSYYPSRVRDDE